MTRPKILAFSGGVGGAKLAHGLALQLERGELAIVCNTGDDFEHQGLTICPDLDTVMYTLAGKSHPQQGWGLAGESFRVMDQLAQLGGASWFRLGDLDLATHLYRLGRLRAGASLSLITAELCAALGIAHAVWPMSDDNVRTVVKTAQGELAFQHYFVRDQCRPVVTGFRFAGIDAAVPLAAMMAALNDPGLHALILCPSNPFVSLDPIINLPGVRAAVRHTRATVVAVSPIVGGKAIKGPAAKMMAELGHDVSAHSVARYYTDLLDGFIIDHADAGLAGDIEALGMSVLVTNTVMNSDRERATLAAEAMLFASGLKRRR